jgi:tripartite-type tricarboxylate transporter receptor subunit TctC
MNFTKRFLTIAAMTLAAGSASLHAQPGDGYPSRAIRMLVPLSAGTTTDIVARTLAERVSKKLGQPIVVENKQGAGGVIATQSALAGGADGYTILMVNSQHVINPSVYKSLPYDTLKDFKGIAMVAEAPAIVAVSQKLGVRTLKDFIALAKKKPGQIHYASSGIGSQTHLAGAYFAREAGIDLAHVPYSGSGAVIPDLITGRVEAVFAPIAFVSGAVKEGKLVALGVTSKAAIRTPFEAPSVSDTVPGYEYSTWFGFVVPAKVPPAVVEKLAAAFASAMSDADVKSRFADQGIVPRVLLRSEFDAYMKADMDRLAPVVKSAGLAEEK